MRFFLIRHGRTEWNSQGRYQGSIDVPLDETGKKQAEMLAKSLACVSIDKVWSSPLERAKDTALCISGEQGCPLEIHEGLGEISHGEWEGRYAEEVKKTLGYDSLSHLTKKQASDIISYLKGVEENLHDTTEPMTPEEFEKMQEKFFGD